jgi:hypothetical protein
MYDLAGLDLDALRAKLGHERQGTAPLREVHAVYLLARPRTSKEPRQAFVIQLKEVVEEWRRRRPTSLR